MTTNATTRPLRFVVIGAGMSGILAAIRLRDAGFGDVQLYEKAARLGGTWRDNRYPGVSCDVPSHLYCYSFEPNPEWSHRYAPGAEILAYFEGVAKRHGLDRRVRYGEEITSATWRGGRWQLRTSRGRDDVADVVIAATGVLHHPNLPDIDGLADFAGPCFHTARWDQSVALDGRRVGVIGTGSSAVQVVGSIVDRVAELVLFQRTAQWIAPLDNPAYTPDEVTQYRRDPASLRDLRTELSRTFADAFANAVVDSGSERLAQIEEACRANLEHSVRDPELRERLRPDYRAACKRLVVSADFYRAIQQPNAHLVTEHIERVEPSGVRTVDGVLHEVDVLVLATGFRTDRFLRPIDVAGPDGLRLDDVWAARPSAYLSVSVPGFPNLFLLNGPNGPVGNFSLIEVAELQMGYLLQLVDLLATGRAGEVSADAAAAARFEAERVAAAAGTVWSTGCRSWYLDDRGVPAAWPWTFDEFRRRMAVPDLDDFDVRS